MFDGSVYMAAGAFLYVTECEALSFDGLNQGLKQIRDFNQTRVDENIERSHLLGIVPNRFRRGTENHEHNLKVAKEAFGRRCGHPIPLRTLISESTNFRQALYAYAPSSKEAKMMWRLVTRFEEAVTAWEAE